MNILLASSISEKATELLKSNHNLICAYSAPEEKLKSLIGEVEVLVFRSGVQISADVMKAAPKLKMLIRAGSGLDNIDMKYVKNNNLLLNRIPQPGAKAVAELSFSMMLNLARNVFEGDQKLRAGIWAKRQLTGYLLTGKVLGIIGAGNIGSKVGEMGTAWGMRAIGCVEYDTQITRNILLSKGIKLLPFDQVIKTADFLSIHVPLTDKTKNLIDKKVLAKMKSGSYLVNLSRGGVVNEKDLYEALTKGKKLRGVGLDVHEKEGEVFSSPFTNLQNVVLTPHIGAQTFDSQEEIGEKILRIVDEYQIERERLLKDRKKAS